MKSHSASILRLSPASHTNCMSWGVTSALGVTNSPNHWMVNAYKNIMNAMQSNQNRGIGLPKCLLEVKELQLDTVIPFDLLSVDSI